MNRGKYIVIEGPEGVGKTTQIHSLAERFRAANLPIRVMREPDSQSDVTARAIRHITQDPHYPLNTKTEVLLYNAARSQSLDIIRQSINSGVNCIVDRNYLTTLAIQYYGRGDVPNYSTINTIIKFAVDEMEPDLTVVLDAPVNVLKERLKYRLSGERFDNLDYSFLERVRAGYLWEAKQRNIPVILATYSQDQVTEDIWKYVTKALAIRNKVQQTSIEPPVSVKEVIESKAEDNLAIKTEAKKEVNVSETEELVIKNDQGMYEITEKGKEYLDQTVSDSEGNVYSFSDKLSPITIAAAMARLSRRGDDMRITILDEFANKADKDGDLLKRIITAYGDDSVQQLGGIHVVVENASNILTKKLEWGRLASYLEQSTRYIFFDQKDKDGKYRYFVPENLKKDVKEQYIKTMDEIFSTYSEVVRELTDYVRKNSDTPESEQDVAWKGATRAQACDAARFMLPVSTKSTVGIFASGQAIESLIMHLLSDDLLEARETGEALLKESRKVIPMFLERADKPDRGGAQIAYTANTRNNLKQLAKVNLPDTLSSDISEPVKLIDYWPKNELLLVADMLYEHSNLSLEEIQSSVNSWSYDKKMEVFKAYMGERLNRRHRPGRALEKAHYSFDLICDYGIFRDLQRHRMVDDLNWQLLTPRYGYDIPKLIEEANLTEKYEKVFDLSLELYSNLQKAGYALEAQYATLLGHKMRWKVTYNAREAFHLHELRTAPQGHPGYRKLAGLMHEKVAEVHPQIAEAMIFVNKAEDPKLTRLAAEKYTQFKLNQLDKK
jgi:dTMP kinase